MAARIPPAAAGPPPTPADLVAEGFAALADGRWEDAIAALEAAVDHTPEHASQRCQVLEALSEALWWAGRPDEALATRQRAYEGWRVLGEDDAATKAAAWLAREYAASLGTDAASGGWLARAETLAAGASEETVAWVALTRAVLAADPHARAEAARAAVAGARAAGSGDIEVLALGQLGLAAVATGQLDEGMTMLDEAMAAATGGEAGLATLAALCCDLVVASELTGDLDRFAQWNEVVEALAVRYGHPGLVSFCSTCCAEAFAAAGDWRGAEQQLRAALKILRATGHRARCFPPAAKLADLLVSQGRLEEARQVLEGEPGDEALVVRARLALIDGDPATAAQLAARACRRLGGPSLLTTATMGLLVQAHLAAGSPAAAAATAAQLHEVAEASGHRRTLGWALLARARVTAATGEPAQVRSLLEEALDHLTETAPGAVETAQARLELAHVCAADAPQLAVAEARAALAAFDAAGATHAADAAAALLRRLGDRSRVGVKKAGTLTNREQEVLRLVAQGLTNAEIADRLFISPKTAGNHVSSILAKLGLRSRVEAAAHASASADR